MSERDGLRRSLLPVLLAMAGTLIPGCASFRQTCEYYPDGRLSTYSLRSTVLGTGETEAVSTDCALTAYSTKDTGLSDNGKAAIGEISEGAVRALIPTP